MDGLGASPHTSVNTALHGFCSINAGEDVPCQTVEISIDRLVIRSNATVAFADEAILSLPHIGLLKAVVNRVFDGGFSVAFEPAPLSKLGLYLEWLTGQPERPVGRDARRFDRIIPIRRVIRLERADEPASMARIIDLSRSGVAFTTSKALVVGEKIRLGDHKGTVVRVAAGAAAASFDTLLEETGFGVMIDLNKTASTSFTNVAARTDLAAPNRRPRWPSSSEASV